MHFEIRMWFSNDHKILIVKLCDVITTQYTQLYKYFNFRGIAGLISESLITQLIVISFLYDQ